MPSFLEHNPIPEWVELWKTHPIMFWKQYWKERKAGKLPPDFCYGNQKNLKYGTQMGYEPDGIDATTDKAAKQKAQEDEEL